MERNFRTYHKGQKKGEIGTKGHENNQVIECCKTTNRKIGWETNKNIL
jgi:hypothetical protein